MRMCHFRAKNGPFILNEIFLVQTIIITFIYLSALFIVQNLKKFLLQIQSYEDAQFLGPKWPIYPNENFFRKTVNKPCFFHPCLSTCQRSKSDINLLVKYWRLKNTDIGWEPFLAILWELDFSQACSFHGMLMNYKNFHFTWIPNKANDVIFLKSPKTMLLGHFWPFSPDRGFFQKIQLCHTQLYMGP